MPQQLLDALSSGPYSALVFHPELLRTIDELVPEITEISPPRVERLTALTRFIEERLKKGQPVHLNFVCTHNSRRSHLAQVWGQVAAQYFGYNTVTTFSGGTETTTVNPRTIAALVRAGFQVKNPGGDNPRYEVSYGPEEPPLICFSKLVDDPENKSSDFAAIMTCTEADQNCPVVPNATRISLPYVDPKEADDTPDEARRYDERCAQIGVEMLAAFGAVMLD